jgi:hypothetical protein
MSDEHLVISIAGRWAASEFSAELSAIEYFYISEVIFSDLERRYAPDFAYMSLEHRSVWRLLRMRYFYSLGAALKRLSMSTDERTLMLLSRGATPEIIARFTVPGVPIGTLQVSKLEYSSPGLQDLAGVGKIIKEVRIFIKYLMDRSQRREEHEAKMERQRVDNETKHIQNQERALRLLQRAGYTKKQIRAIMEQRARQQRIIEDLIDAGKITQVASTDDLPRSLP